MELLTRIPVTEWIGYTASILVLISLSMSNIGRLRWFNLAGASTFAVYGYLIDAWPVTLMNTAIACVNVYYLIQLYTQRDYFTVRRVAADDSYLNEFLAFHRRLIERYYPNADIELDHDAFVLLALRNMAVAGVFAAQRSDAATLRILFDFVVPEYADRKVGRFLYRDSSQVFTADGIDRLVVDRKDARDPGFFRAMGFHSSSDGETLVLHLSNDRSGQAV